jgi:gas vesicle protein
MFQGAKALSDLVKAVKTGLEARRLAKADIQALTQKAEDQSKQISENSKQAAASLSPALDKGIADIFDKKINDVKKKYKDAILDPNSNERDWAKATDICNADICALLRNLKSVNGGILPDPFYDFWIDHGCR